MNKESKVEGGEISHRDILLTFLDGSYLPTFSPVNMMMNNISWRADECVSPGEGPGSRRLRLTLTYSFVTLFSLRMGIRGERRESEVDNRCHHTRLPLRSTPVRDPVRLLQHPLKHFHINNQAIFLHANPSKRAEANLRAWAASFFSGVPDSLADICPAVCGTQSSCPVSTDWSEAGCGGGT